MTVERSLIRSLAGEGARMAVLSLASLGLGYVLTLAFLGLGLPAEAAFACSVAICSIMNFFGCRHYVFHGKMGPLWQEAAKFFPTVFVFRAIEVVLFSALNAWLDNYHFAYFAAVGASMVVKLLISRYFIFTRRTE